MITLIAIQQEMVWKHTIKQCLHYDFYHSWDYHRMSEEGVPFLFKFSYGDDLIVLPLLKRNIPNSKFFDLTSVCGYPGPLSNKRFENISIQMKSAFKREFSAFLRDNRIVSVFCRLNPFLKQLLLMDGFEGVYANGKIVVMDLRQSFEEQLLRYRKNHFKKILKIKQQGFYVKECHSPNAVRDFAAIYSENMRFVGAGTFYSFKESYFEKFLHSKDLNTKLFLVYHNDIAVCGMVVVCANKIMHAHLLATKTAYRKFAPATLLTHEVSVMGRESGMHYLNLGGGSGFKQDALFDWKSAFSDLLLAYFSWRHVADPKAYRRLTQQANLPPGNEVDYFPLYRYKPGIAEQGQMPDAVSPMKLMITEKIPN